MQKSSFLKLSTHISHNMIQLFAVPLYLWETSCRLKNGRRSRFRPLNLPLQVTSQN